MKMSLATIISIVVTVIAFMLLLASFVVIDGYVGVVKRSRPQLDYLPEGFHQNAVDEIVEEFDVRLSKVKTEAGHRRETCRL